LRDKTWCLFPSHSHSQAGHSHIQQYRLIRESTDERIATSAMRHQYQHQIFLLILFSVASFCLIKPERIFSTIICIMLTVPFHQIIETSSKPSMH
jgi:hypothetical protein